MANFKKIGFRSFEEYINYFFNTLLTSNKTYSYFVDWSKVTEAVNKYLSEIYLLNSLIKIDSSKREKYLYDLLLDYPQVVEVIPLIIAERLKNEKIDILDPEIEDVVTFEFESSLINENNIHKIIEFCRRTGILDLFEKIKDLYDYLVGVEVGLDTNARKNRSGDIFEKMCKQKIKKLISQRDYIIVENDLNFYLYEGKNHDIVVYNKNRTPILVIECNFYNVSGSKPISIAESYIEMTKIAKEKEINFLWVSDGPAWRNIKNSLLRSIKEIDFVLNFKMLKYLKKVLK